MSTKPPPFKYDEHYTCWEDGDIHVIQFWGQRAKLLFSSPYNNYFLSDMTYYVMLLLVAYSDTSITLSINACEYH